MISSVIITSLNLMQNGGTALFYAKTNAIKAYLKGLGAT